MYNTLGIFSLGPTTGLPTVSGGVGPRAYALGRPITAQGGTSLGGAGNDVISIGGGVGPAGPPGPPGPAGPPGTPGLVPVTDVVTATYTALATDYYLCVLTNGLVTITLPTGILGTVYIIKDCFGNAANFPITIQGTGGETIDGSATGTINTNFGSVTLIFNGVEWNIV